MSLIRSDPQIHPCDPFRIVGVFLKSQLFTLGEVFFLCVMQPGRNPVFSSR